MDAVVGQQGGKSLCSGKNVSMCCFRLYPFAERPYRYYIQVKTDLNGPYETVIRQQTSIIQE